MDEELKYKLIDRFEGFELVEFLDINIRDIVEAFPEIITENTEVLEEFLVHGR